MSIYERLKFKHNLTAPIILDLGANIGLESRKLYSVFPDSKIILVEPNEECKKEIEDYVLANNLQDNWFVDICAVDTSSGEKEFGFHHSLGMFGRLNGSLDPFNWSNWNYEGTKKVITKTISEICPNPKIVKMDIERHEYKILPELVKIPSIDIIYAEMHGPCYDLNIVGFLDEILKDTGLVVSGWFDVHQPQDGNDDLYVRDIPPQENIPCGQYKYIVIERKPI